MVGAKEALDKNRKFIRARTIGKYDYCANCGRTERE